MAPTRPSGREPSAMRELRFTTGFTAHPAGSVLVEFGGTRVLCTASVEDRVPGFMRGKGKGWVTAEYGMLPGSTHQRVDREAARGKQSGRTVEIQRLIGRSLRAAMDMDKMGEKTIRIDCDVLQADGGTRTASITGGALALAIAAKKSGIQDAFSGFVASISVGIWKGMPVLDLDYAEDSTAETDMNVVMVEDGGFIEIQGTAEQAPFAATELTSMLELAGAGIEGIIKAQRQALSEA